MITHSRILTAFALVLTFAFAHAAPVLDTAFGTQGISRIGQPSGYEDVTTASASQPDGKIIVAGTSTGRQNYAFVTRFTASGAIDASFGNAGTILLPPPASHVWMAPVGVDFGAGGEVIVTSVVHDGFVLTRLSAAGALDAAFGSGGSVVVLDPEAPSGSSETAPVRTSVQADGSIVVMSDASSNGNFVLRFRRFLANGTLDATFGNAGVRVLAGLPSNFMFTDARNAIVERSGAGGFTLLAVPSIANGTYLVVRVTLQGTLDTTFGGVGYRSGFDLGNPSDTPSAIVRTSDGGYVLAGIGQTAPGRFEDVLWKIDASGARVSGYGGTGLAPAGGLAAASRVLAALPDGAVAIAQGTGGATWRFGIHEANGAMRPGFGTAGGSMVPIAGYLVATPVGLHVDGAGRVTAAGWASKRQVVSGVTVLQRGNDAILASVGASGQPRADFGRGDGVAFWNNPAFSNDTIHGLVIDPQGRIDVAGFSDSSGTFDYLVARLDANGQPDPAFATDGRLTPGLPARFVGVARAVVQPNGAIVVASGDAGGSFGSVRSATIFRASVNGAFDGNYRPAVLPAGPNGTVGLGVRPDGRVVYLTNEFTATAPGTSSYVLQQFLQDGSPDPSFGTNGRASFPAFAFDNAMLGDVVVLPDGSVAFATFSGATVRVYKVSASGALVTTFGNGGIATSTASDITYNVSTNVRLLALSDGTLMTVGAVYNSMLANTVQRAIQVVRFSATGSVIGARPIAMDAGSNTMAAVALPDASVVIGRVVAPRVATLARLLPDGQFDQAFGGETGTPVTFTAVSALALDARGGIIVGGQDASSALVARYRLDVAAASAPAVEFYNTNLRHYFVTAGPGEIAIIEAGGAGPGWQRTGNDFRVWIPETGVPVGAVPVCRFYGTPGRGPNSHFYTANPAECAAVKLDPGWTYEGFAFYVMPPVNDACPGFSAVHRAYNNGFASNDSNHRYSTQRPLLQAMTSQGWSVEGVAFCGAAN